MNIGFTKILIRLINLDPQHWFANVNMTTIEIWTEYMGHAVSTILLTLLPEALVSRRLVADRWPVQPKIEGLFMNLVLYIFPRVEDPAGVEPDPTLKRKKPGSGR